MPVEPSGAPHARVLGLYLAPVPDQLDVLSDDLDAAFEGCPGGLERVLLNRWRDEVTTRTERSGSSSVVYGEIVGECLPETFHHATSAGGPAPLAALLYEVEARYPPGPEAMTSWSETVELPCRLLTIDVRTAAGTRVEVVPRGVRIAMPQSHLDRSAESAVLTRCALAGRGRATMPYPLVGAAYTLDWTTVRPRSSV
jgi:hypothetical protein